MATTDPSPRKHLPGLPLRKSHVLNYTAERNVAEAWN
jgi:hypothetical protein